MATEQFFDFEDTNNFLSVLSESIPSLDKSADWNADLHGSLFRPSVFAPKSEPFSAVMLSPNGSMNNDTGVVSPGSNSPRTYNGLDQAAPYASSNNYSDSVDSNFFASLEHTPTSEKSPTTAGKHSLHTPPLSTHLSPHSDKAHSESIQGITQSPEHERFRLDSTGSEDYSKLEPSDKPKSASKSKVTKPAKKGKTSHNVIEKKYRTNINSKIIELRNAVPTLRIATGIKDVSVADLGGLAPAVKLNKASVLTKATEYIKHLEKKNESLSSKIESLQALLNQAASTTQPVSSSSATYAPEPTQDANDFFASQFSGQETPSSVSARSSLASSQSQSPQTNNVPNSFNQNQFMGGMGLMFGSAFISDDTFSGLAAVPLFPTALMGTSAASAQFVTSARVLFFALGFFMAALATKNAFGISPSPKQSTSLSPVQLLTLRLKSLEALSEADKQEVISTILGQKQTTLSQLVKYYMLLSTKQATFETTFLSILIGVLITERAPLASKFIGFNLKKKCRRLSSFKEDSEGALGQLQKLVQVDELGMFKSDSFAKRLNNLSQKLPICHGIKNGESRLDFVDVYLKHKSDLYDLMFSWRVLEIIHELNLYYLELLASPADKRDDGMESIKEEMGKLKDILEDDSPLKERFTLFEMVVFTDCSPENLTTMKKDLLKKLSAVTSHFQEDDYLEDCSDDESVADSEHSSAEQSIDLVASNPSLVYSLNLISEEKFIVMATSLISYNLKHKVTEEPFQLLHYLKFEENKKNLSLLSFTCLVKLLSLVVKDEEEESGEEAVEGEENARAKVDSHNFIVLESLIKMMRGWLSSESERNIMSQGLLSDLSELVINKGLVLNDI